jgi:arginyl-tRNA synthetase
VQVDHVPFGMVMTMGPDGKPTKIKTREGKTIKLIDLLDEGK